jgi:hypothetical protein
VLAATFDESGQAVDQKMEPYRVRVKSEELERLERDGIVYVQRLPVKKPGAYQFRVAVRDLGSNQIGSANEFIEVPDLNKGRLALSGIVLEGAEVAGQKATGARSGPAVREVHGGMQLSYSLFIYNALLDKRSGRTQLETRMRLFHDGRVMYEGQVKQESPTDQVGKEEKRFQVKGEMQLSNKIAPGDYVLQYIVTDRLAQKEPATVAQWIDFRVIP